MREMSFLSDSRLVRLMNVLEPTYVVGGAVRNAIRGTAPSDVDLATPLLPEEVTHRAESHGFSVHPTGIAHGTVTVVVDGAPFEITTFRRDVATDGRRATVKFTESMLSDALRRDFTMNALYADVAGNVYDPIGFGITHAETGYVKFIGRARDRIEEDRLRALRFFRFHAMYGSGEMDDEALGAIYNARNSLDILSRERVTMEFSKIITHPNCESVIGAMSDLKIISSLLNSTWFNTLSLERAHRICRTYGLTMSLPCALATLMNNSSSLFGPTQTSKSLILSRRDRDRTELLARLALNLFGITDHTMKEREIVKITVEHGIEVATEVAICVDSDFTFDFVDGSTFVSIAMDLSHRISTGEYTIPVFPVTGQDLIDRGISHGPKIGNLLRIMKFRWESNGYTLDKETLIADALRRY